MTKTGAPDAREPTDARVAIGFLLRAHGLRGEVRVKLFNPESDLLGQVQSVTLRGRDGAERSVRIVAARPAGDTWLMQVEGVSDRDAAEALRGSEVLVERSLFPELDEDEIYLVDLIGFEVREGETKIGRVEAVFEYPSVDCLQVVGDDGVRELPMLDEFVEGIDEERRIVFARRVDELPVEPLKKGARSP